MSTITQIVDPYTKVPSINSPSTFNSDVDVFLNEINSRVMQTNTQSSQMNTVAGEVNTNAGIATTKASEASASAISANNAKEAAETARDEAVAAVATIPDGTINDMITTSVDTWSSQKISNELDSKQDTLISGTNIKTINSSSILESGNVDLLTKANPSITGSITEQVYNLTGTEINPANGTIQYKTVTANTTFTENLTAGQSVVLRLINADAYTITYPTITWITATAPTLTANCVVIIWKEQTTLYGAYIGSLV